MQSTLITHKSLLILICVFIADNTRAITLNLHTKGSLTNKNRQKIHPIDHNRLQRQKVLLISLDGFGSDTLHKTSMPNIENIKKLGVSVDYVKNVFPTKTLPNHQSVITGLYPESHGIIDNDFLNPLNGRIFHGESDSEWWNQSTPIWTENQKAGHKSGVMCWPGYRVTYGNWTPDYIPNSDYKGEYEKSKSKIMSFTERLKLVIDWLKDDEVTFVALYTGDIDEAGHEYGKGTKQYAKATERIDKMIGDLQEQLEETKLIDVVNVILIGDHGMTQTSYKKVIHLDDFINTKTDLKYVFGFTSMHLYTKYNTTQLVYEKLYKASQERNSHFKVYLKKDIPEEFHLKKNNNTGPIFILPDLGWVILSKSQNVPYLVGKWERGEHGYTNKERSMNPGFYGYGPMFKKNYHIKTFEIVDLFSLMSYILDLKINERDGKFNRIKTLLKDFPDPKNEHND